MRLVQAMSLLLGLILGAALHSTQATAEDPAVIQVQTLTSALLKSMQAGTATSPSGRYRALEPVIEQVFALPLMARLSAGPGWVDFAPEQQTAVIAAFSRFTIANYASNFRSFDGQRFEVDDGVVRRGGEKIVRSRIIPSADAPTKLLYRMLQVDGEWRIVDVYYDGISQLTLHRADFAGAIAAGGAPALIAYLNKASGDLMK